MRASEMCCTRLAANTGRKNDAKKIAIWYRRTTLSGYIFTTKAVSTIGKQHLLSSNISSTCPYNMVNFGVTAGETLLKLSVRGMETAQVTPLRRTLSSSP